MNELINHEGVCRTAPATPGLLTIGNYKEIPTTQLGMISLIGDTFPLFSNVISVAYNDGLYTGIKKLNNLVIIYRLTKYHHGLCRHMNPL